MKKILFIVPAILVFGFFAVTYRDHSHVVKDQEYIQNMMSNINKSYQISVRQIESLRGYLVQMQSFFEQDVENVEQSYETYHKLFNEMYNKMQDLDRTAASLAEYCGNIGAYKNNLCTNYKENVAAVKKNYGELIKKYNSTITAYNYYADASLLGI